MTPVAEPACFAAEKAAAGKSHALWAPQEIADDFLGPRRGRQRSYCPKKGRRLP